MSLVAFGIFATATHGLAAVLATALPALDILGLFTFVRLVETAVEKRGPPAAHRGHPPLLRDAGPGPAALFHSPGSLPWVFASADRHNYPIR
jgi:hypothetical protein